MMPIDSRTNSSSRPVAARMHPAPADRRAAAEREPEPSAGHAHPDRAAALVGRATEREALAAALDRLAAGCGGVLEVLGDPGVGKTRLLAELRRQAADRGMPVLYGRAAEAGHQTPLHLFADALNAHPGRQRAFAALSAQDAGLLGPLLGFAPQTWAAGCARPPAPGPLGRGADRSADAGRPVHALRRLLTELAAEPTVLALDDVHAADPEALAALDDLVRHPLAAPLLLVVAHRNRQTPLRLRSALAEGADRYAAERIALGPLSITEAAALVGPLPVGRSLQRVYLESQGNPLYLLLSARGRVGEAAADPDDACWSDGADRLEERILREIDGLGAAEFTVAAGAAVLGGRFDAGTLAAVSGLDDAEVRVALPALTRRDVLRPTRAGGEFTFRHPFVRQVLYERTYPAWRVDAHRRAAALLAARGGCPRDRAYHLERCTPPWSPEDTATLQAAAAAALACAPAEAAHWLRLALATLPAQPADDPAHLRLRYLLARALERAGRPAESRALLQGLLAAVRGDSSGLHHAVVTLAARVERLLGRYRESEALLRGLLATADPAQGGAARPDADPTAVPGEAVDLCVGPTAAIDPGGDPGITPTPVPGTVSRTDTAARRGAPAGTDMGTSAGTDTGAFAGTRSDAFTATAGTAAGPKDAGTNVGTPARTTAAPTPVASAAVTPGPAPSPVVPGDLTLDVAPTAAPAPSVALDPTPADVRAVAEARAELVVTGLLAGGYQAVRKEADRAAADAVRLGDRVLEARTLALRALGDAYEGRTVPAAAFAADAARLVAALADAELGGDCETLYTLGCAELFLERLTDAERHLRRGEMIARHADHHYARARLCLARAELRLRTGQVAAALEQTARAEWCARRAGSADLIGLARAMREPAALWSGVPAHPQDQPSQTGEAWPRAGAHTGWWAGAARAFTADAALAGGDPLGCRQTLLDAGGGPGLPRLPLADRPRLFGVLTLAALAVDDRSGGAEFAGRAERAAAGLGLTGQRGHAIAAAAAVLAARGEQAAAVAGYAEAVACFAAVGLELDQGRAHFGAAVVLAALGRSAEAAACLDSVGRIAERCGAGRLACQAERVRATLDPGPAGSDADPLAGLTAREREVAILVGQGVTSRQAAERLQLSTRTVDSHLARIYHKLGISSRAALARLVERGLRRPESPAATRLRPGQPGPAPASMRIA